MANRRRANGDGSLTQLPDGRYMARLDLGWKDGKRQRKAVFGRTKAEALKKLAKVRADNDQGLPVVMNERATVAQFLDRWYVDAAKPSVRPKTATRYEQLIRLHIVPAIGRIQLTKLTPQHVQNLYASKLDGKLAPRSVHHIHCLLHHALETAVRWNTIPRNPCDAVDPPRVPRKEMNVFSQEQARDFIAAVSGDPLEALYITAITTGMRQGELLALRWRDIDLEAGVITVRRTIGRVKGKGFVESEPKSAKSRRRVSLSPIAVEALTRHREKQLADRIEKDLLPGPDSLVFGNGVGKHIEPQNLLYRSYYPLLKRAGLPKIRFHDLRHSAATLLLSMGTHPKIVSELLGHSQIGLTLDTYSHVLPGLQKQAVDDLSAMLTRTGA
jgi:integrase